MSDNEEYGGDPPCWAHLFEGEESEGQEPAPTAANAAVDEGIVDLATVAQAAVAQGAVWTRQSEDLDVNLLVFKAGEGVAAHVNGEVDVLLVGVAGEGVVTVNGKRHALHTGHLLVIAKGACRSTESMSGSFAYLSCHRHRGGLWPTD